MQLLPELSRCRTCHAFEEPDEMLRILETERLGDLRDAFLRIQKLFFRRFQQFLPQVFFGGHSRLALYQIPEIVRGQTYLIRKIVHGRQS